MACVQAVVDYRISVQVFGTYYTVITQLSRNSNLELRLGPHNGKN